MLKSNTTAVSVAFQSPFRFSFIVGSGQPRRFRCQFPCLANAASSRGLSRVMSHYFTQAAALASALSMRCAAKMDSIFLVNEPGKSPLCICLWFFEYNSENDSNRRF